MITIQTAGNTFVGTSQGEIYLPSAGSWSVPDVTYVAYGTNAQVNISADTREGALIYVDPAGAVRVQNGPDLIGSSVLGFALAVSSLGVFMGIRWAWRKIMGGVGVSTALD